MSEGAGRQAPPGCGWVLAVLQRVQDYELKGSLLVENLVKKQQNTSSKATILDELLMWVTLSHLLLRKQEQTALLVLVFCT